MLNHPHDLWELVSKTSVPLTTVLLILATIVAVNIVHLLRPRTTRGNRGMSENDERLKRERKRADVSDAFGDALLDLWADDKINKDDYNYYCRRLAEEYGFTDLRRRPPVMHPAALRRRLERLKVALQQQKEKRANGKVTVLDTTTGPLSQRLKSLAGK